METSPSSENRIPEFLAPICRAVPYTTLVFDAQGRCAMAAAGSEPVCGPELALERNIDELGFMLSRDAMELIRSARVNATACSFECDDGARWIELRAEPAGEGWVIAVLRETTEKRRTHITLDRKMRESAMQLARNAELLDELDRQLSLIRRQHEQIAALSAPLLEVSDRVLALPLIGELDDARVRIVTQQVLAAVSARRCLFVIVDLTGVVNMKATEAALLLSLAKAIRLLGARCILSGFSPELARTSATLEIDFSSALAFQNIREALAFCLKQSWG